MSEIGMFQQSRAVVCGDAVFLALQWPSRPGPCALRLSGRQGLQATFGRLKKWLVSWGPRLDFWPTFKGALAAHEWVIYLFFLLLVLIFFRNVLG